MSAIEGRRCKHCGWFVSKLQLDLAKFNIQCARCGPNGYLEPATLPGGVKKLRAGHDFPCAIHRGPAGDCNEWNCKC